MAFFLTTNSDSSYDKIVEKLISKGVYFSKDLNGGTITLEIHGNSQDYQDFKSMIESGAISAYLEEAI
jgi:hypothetical protein